MWGPIHIPVHHNTYCQICQKKITRSKVDYVCKERKQNGPSSQRDKLPEFLQAAYIHNTGKTRALASGLPMVTSCNLSWDDETSIPASVPPASSPREIVLLSFDPHYLLLASRSVQTMTSITATDTNSTCTSNHRALCFSVD